MSGVISYGAYIPFYRLSRAEIDRAWGRPQSPGERAIANYDEDSLTMAVAAARDCLKGFNSGEIDALYFASTTAPYREKQTAATIATVLGLPGDALTLDFSGSLRSGTSALRAALDAVDAGRARSVLVCAAETRQGYPAGQYEMCFGDGAGAVLVGKSNVIAEIEKSYSCNYEIQDIWRSDRDTFVRSAEDRFAMEEGYVLVMVELIQSSLKKAGLAAKDLTRVAISSPNSRQLHLVAQRAGFEDKLQPLDFLHSNVGETGSALSLMALAANLEKAGPDETILLAGYGNGADLFLLKTGEKINGLKDRRAIARYQASKGLINNYNRFMQWRELVQTQPPARPPIEIRQPSPAAQWREAHWELRLTGTRCKNCGTPQYPPQRVCLVCHHKDEMDPYTFYDQPAKLFSFSHDWVMQTTDPPVTVSVVDFEGGGRLICDMTDRDPAGCKVGMPLEMSLRRLYYVNGIYNYWWKCLPVRA